MDQELEPFNSSEFTPETVQLALRVLAEAGGSSTQARARLAEEFELDRVPSRTALEYWRDHKFPIRYRQIANEHDAQLEEIVKGQLRTATIRHGEIQAAIHERLANEIEKLPADKLPDAAYKTALARGIDIDKLRLLDDKPTHITEARSTGELLRDIAGHLNLIDEEPIPEAEVIEPANTQTTNDETQHPHTLGC